MTSLNSRWSQLTARERGMVMAGSVFIVVMLVWTWAVGPALAVLRSAPQQREILSTQLHRVQTLAAEAAQIRSATTRSSPNPSFLKPAMEATISSRIGPSARLELTSEGAIIRVEMAIPSALADTLEALRTQHQLVATSAQLAQNPNRQGYWQGQISFKGAGLSLP